MVVCGVSVDTIIIHTFLSVPACTDMVYSTELERDVTTTAIAKELPHLKTLASYMIVSIFTPEGQIKAVMYMPNVKCSCLS